MKIFLQDRWFGCLVVWALLAISTSAETIPLNVPAGGQTGLTLMPVESTGIAFTNFLPQQRFRTNQILLNGSGVAAGDVDGDGRCDLYFCRLDGPNVLYRNLGNWRFADVTQTAGVACPDMDAAGAVFADLDGDGDLDLIVSTVGQGTHVFLNNGRGQFTELTKANPLNTGKGGMSMALGDLDGDGWLELYVANYRTSALMDMPNTHFQLRNVGGKQVVATVNGRPVTEPELANRYRVNDRGGIDELGEADVLYRNLQGTNLTPVSFTGGQFLDEDGRPLASAPFDWGLSVMIRDLNQDGLPDIFVCNDFDTPDRIWINQGNGKFRLISRLALRKSTLFSMAVDVGDVNRDGHDDLFVLDMLSRNRVHRLTTAGDRKPPVSTIGQFDNRPEYMMNMLFLNRGDATYTEIGQLAGVHASEWSWATVFLDVDLDGWEDILISNGNERESRHMDVAAQIKTMRTQGQLTRDQIFNARGLFPRYATPNLAFRNRRDLTFEEVSRQWGFDLVGVSHGIALADLDNDGDLDVVINNLNSATAIYRNESSAPRVAVRLKGNAPNTAGIGARITVHGGPVVQSQEIICGGRYLSSDEPLRVFAAGSATNRLTIEVRWRSGRQSRVTGVQPNQLCVIEEPPLSTPVTLSPGSAAAQRHAGPPLFEDVSHFIFHTHRDELFNDFARQPTMPNKLSQLGPGVTWSDLDGDGWDDLVVTSGKGGQLGCFRNNQKGGFAPWPEIAGVPAAPRDETTAVAWSGPGGERALLVGSASYEEGPSGSAVRQYNLKQKSIRDIPLDQTASTGPLSLADYDSDGDLDLFIGGRCLPGKYPEPVSSMLLRNENGHWQVDSNNSRLLTAAGMVSGAAFSDLDADGDPELILACEWGAIRVFRNDRGHFQEITQELGLANYRGWWNGVATGDLDGDGRLDIIASNWGRNTRYEPNRNQPLQLFYLDWDADGATEMVETHVDPNLKKRMPERGLDFLARALPFIRESFPTHAKYAAAGVDEILGSFRDTARSLEANWLDSTVFFNRGNAFSVQPLPLEAQYAPAFGICVADLDGDGDQDIFLAQNFFATQPETPRYDGGRGLWLQNDGKGQFTAVPGQTSGIKIYGEQRGCAVADYDQDGRLDLAVGQNGALTHLYHNVGARPGLRVRLAGPPGNPDAIGAVVRVISAGRSSPACEIQSGLGYWSSHSPVLVLPVLAPPAELQVRWPGGKTTTTSIPAGVAEVRLDPAGNVLGKR